MDIFGWIRGLTGRESDTPPPWERGYTAFLKLVSCHEVGAALAISHYIADPDERPDYLLRRDAIQRSCPQGDIVTTLWTVKAITPEEDARLERMPGEPRSQHL